MAPLFLNYPSWLSPTIFPGLPFRWYGLGYVVGFTIAVLLMLYLVKKEKNPRCLANAQEVIDATIVALIGGIVAGRLTGTLVYNPEYFLPRPWLIVFPFENGEFTGYSGMSYHGGLLGIVGAFVLYARKRGKSILGLLDIGSLVTPLGYTFGRLGNFANGELYGRVTAVSWGMIFPLAERFPTSEPWVREIATEVGLNTEGVRSLNLPRHPSQFYEAFLEGVFLWAIMWFIVRKRRVFPGVGVAAYLVGYGVVRFIAEYFRQPDEALGFVVSFSGQKNPPYLLTSLLDFSLGQVLCFLMIVGGGTLFFFSKRHYQKQIAGC